jgi:hypothetical protein
MTQAARYEIVETRYQPKKTTKLDFSGTFEEAKQKALEKAKKNIFLKDGFGAIQNILNIS